MALATTKLVRFCLETMFGPATFVTCATAAIWPTAGPWCLLALQGAKSGRKIAMNERPELESRIGGANVRN
jgi:hypothetical protein